MSFVIRVARGRGFRGFPGIFKKDGDGDGVVEGGEKNAVPGEKTAKH